jgi:heme-degrading monooxygenase HmoA
MKSPWRQIGEMDPDADYIVLASSIPARRWRSTPALFRGSRAVTDQLERTEGVLGFALLAEPIRKRYATLSVWTGEPAIRAFAASAPHRELMAALVDQMADTRFEQWSIRGGDGCPTWPDALARLGIR